MDFCKVKIGRSLAALSASLWAISCAVQDRTPPDELVFALGSNPTDLDPRFATDAFSEKIDRLIFNGLTRQRSSGEVTLDLASSFEQPDPLTYRFTLRSDVSFHNGAPLSSHDVVATFRSILDPGSTSIKRGAFEPLERVEATDDRTVVFRLRRPHAPFPGDLALGIQPAAMLSPGYSRTLIGTGPYRLVEQVKDQYVLLEANPTHFDGAPKTRRLRFKIVPDATVRALELLHGSVDMTQNDLPSFLLSALDGRRGLRVATQASTLVKYLAFNLRDPLTADLRVRRAIAMAIDRDEIIRYKYRGFASPAYSLLTPASFAFSDTLPHLPYAPDKAAAMLDAAGYIDPDGPGPKMRLSLVYRTSLDEVAAAVARVFKAQLRRVGIGLEIQTNEWGVFFEGIKQGDFQLYSLTAVGVKDPDYYSYLYHSSRFPPVGANRVRYRSPEMDRLLDQGRQASDREARRRIYAEVQRLAWEDLPYLPLWSEQNVAVMSPRVAGYTLSANGDFDALTAVVKRPASE